MTDLATTLGDLPAQRGTAPWPDHEYVKGWGVMGLPLDSGHYLALRVPRERLRSLQDRLAPRPSGALVDPR